MEISQNRLFCFYVKRHRICDVAGVEAGRVGYYHDDFSDYPLDVDGDGYIDIVTGSYFGDTLRWRRNPGPAGGEWETLDIEASPNIETIRYFEIDGCGTPEIFPNTPGGPQVFYKLICDQHGKGTGKFQKVVIHEEKSGHGLGFADINGDGRTDIVLAGGWLEQPEDPMDIDPGTEDPVGNIRNYK